MQPYWLGELWKQLIRFSWIYGGSAIAEVHQQNMQKRPCPKHFKIHVTDLFTYTLESTVMVEKPCKISFKKINTKSASYRSRWGRLSSEVVAFVGWKCAFGWHKKHTSKEEGDSQERNHSNYGRKGRSIPCRRWKLLLLLLFFFNYFLSRLMCSDFLDSRPESCCVCDKPHIPKWKLRQRKQLVKSQPWFPGGYLMENNSMEKL